MMAKLVDVYRNEQQKLGRRQLPLQVDENLTVSKPYSQPQRVGGSLDPVTRIFPRYKLNLFRRFSLGPNAFKNYNNYQCQKALFLKI